MTSASDALPSCAVIREVGLRDGLQSVRTILPTERKREWLDDACAAVDRVAPDELI